MDFHNIKSFENRSLVYSLINSTVKHPTLGDFQVLEGISKTKIVRYKVNHVDFDAKAITAIKTHQELKHENLLSFEGMIPVSKKESYFVFEYFKTTLHNQISYHSNVKKKFAEEEILQLLEETTNALAYLQSYNVSHDQIRSDNIVKINSTYKLIDPIYFKRYEAPYKNVPNKVSKLLTKIVSPELAHFAQKNMVDRVNGRFKSDIYALGLVALDAMTVTNDSKVSITDKLDLAAQLYSVKLVGIVRKMLEKVISLRLDSKICNMYLKDINGHPRQSVPEQNSKVLHKGYEGNMSRESNYYRKELKPTKVSTLNHPYFFIEAIYTQYKLGLKSYS